MGLDGMEEPASSDADMETGPLPGDSMGALVASVFDRVFQNIIYDAVSEAHREEKTARMRSAVMIAEDAVVAHQASMIATPQKESATPTSAIPPVFPGKVETPGAVYDNGQITLKGNPLATTKDTICPRCRLPQLQYPTEGEGARVPDPHIKYCKLQPFVKMAGHDIYGNPFPSDNASAARLKKEKKEKEAAAARAHSQAEQASANGSVDTPNGTPPPSSDPRSIKVTSYPWVKCTNASCKRHIQVTRFAKHLDGCMGISGRQSSRNAMAKIEASQGTPAGSRNGTPVPGSRSSPGKGDREDDDDEDEDDDDESDETPKKKKKKLVKRIPEKITGKPKPSKLKEGTTAGKSLPSSSQSKVIESKSSGSQDSTKPKQKTLERSFSESGQSLVANGLIGTTKKLKRLNEISTPSRDKSDRDSSSTNGRASPKSRMESPPKLSPMDAKSKTKILSPLVTSKERTNSISPSKPPSDSKPSNGTLKKRKRDEQLNGESKDRDAFHKKKQKQLGESNSHPVEA